MRPIRSACQAWNYLNWDFTISAHRGVAKGAGGRNGERF